MPIDPPARGWIGFAVTRADAAGRTAAQVDDVSHVGAAPAIDN